MCHKFCRGQCVRRSCGYEHKTRSLELLGASWYILTIEPISFQEAYRIEARANPATDQLITASWPKFAKLCKRWTQIKWLYFFFTVRNLDTFKFTNVAHSFDNLCIIHILNNKIYLESLRCCFCPNSLPQKIVFTCKLGLVIFLVFCLSNMRLYF